MANRKLINSTATPLAGGATYTSASFPVGSLAYIVGIMQADVVGTLYVEFSDDGTTFYGSYPKAYAANNQLSFKAPCTATWGRIRYVNGAGVQAAFHLYWYGQE